MTQGRKTLPSEVKRQRGTLRPDRLPTIDLATTNTKLDIPAEPEELGETGRLVWNLAWGSTWLNSNSDYPIVLVTAQAFDEREEVRAALAATPNDRSLRTSLRELDKQIISGLSLIGFTPSDRSRLGIAEVKKETKLQELLRLKEEKQAERALKWENELGDL